MRVRFWGTRGSIPVALTSADIRDKIFNLYFSTKTGGSGIGLAMAYRVVQLHHGSLEFDSIAGQGTTFTILKSLDWSAAKGARVINMSFAGPRDAVLEKAFVAARQKGIVLIAAAGNAGPKSPPLYPAADPNVIAVAATDAQDRIFPASNRGPHISRA